MNNRIFGVHYSHYLGWDLDEEYKSPNGSNPNSNTNQTTNGNNGTSGSGSGTSTNNTSGNGNASGEGGSSNTSTNNNTPTNKEYDVKFNDQVIGSIDLRGDRPVVTGGLILGENNQVSLSEETIRIIQNASEDGYWETYE